MKKGFFMRVIVPFTVVFYLIIGMVVAVAGTNQLLETKFEKNEAKKMKELPIAVLPEGDAFDAYAKTIVGIDACYIAENGAGIAIIANMITEQVTTRVLVGVNAQGQISGITIIDQGYGSGPYEELSSQEYLKQYIGITQITKTNMADDTNFKQVAGAEEASNSIYQGVKMALEQYKAIYGTSMNNGVLEISITSETNADLRNLHE